MSSPSKALGWESPNLSHPRGIRARQNETRYILNP